MGSRQGLLTARQQVCATPVVWAATITIALAGRREALLP